MTKTPTILIVEDDPDILSLFSMVFRQEGFHVERASGGWAASKFLEGSAPDGVILDMAMPGKSGLSVLQEIRENPRTKKTPVIVVSAVSQEHELYDGTDRAWDEYLEKPIDVHVVVKTMRTLLERSSKRKPAAKVAPKRSPAKAKARAKPKAPARAPKAAAKKSARGSKPKR